ncbi:DUF2716 domain-containing protein [Spirillospora sp. NPDC049024]
MTEGSAAWAPLSESEEDRAWGSFLELTAFRASTRPDRWPGILEPHPSVTWDLARERPVFPGMGWWDFAVEPDDVNSLLHQAFKACVDQGEWLYVLDWQHPCYRFWPHRMTDPENDVSWAVPVFPDGDYFIFLAQDLSFGTFGHPWEAGLCVFGDRLLQAVEERNDGVLDRVLRRSDRAAPEA